MQPAAWELTAIVDTLLPQKLVSGHHKNPDKNLCYETDPEFSSGAEKYHQKCTAKTSPNSDPKTVFTDPPVSTIARPAPCTSSRRVRRRSRATPPGVENRGVGGPWSQLEPCAVLRCCAVLCCAAVLPCAAAAVQPNGSRQSSRTVTDVQGNRLI